MGYQRPPFSGPRQTLTEKWSPGTKSLRQQAVRHHFFIKTHSLIFHSLKSHSKIGKETPRGVDERGCRPSPQGSGCDTTRLRDWHKGACGGQGGTCGRWH